MRQHAPRAQSPPHEPGAPILHGLHGRLQAIRRPFTDRADHGSDPPRPVGTHRRGPARRSAGHEWNALRATRSNRPALPSRLASSAAHAAQNPRDCAICRSRLPRPRQSQASLCVPPRTGILVSATTRFLHTRPVVITSRSAPAPPRPAPPWSNVPATTLCHVGRWLTLYALCSISSLPATLAATSAPCFYRLVTHTRAVHR